MGETKENLWEVEPHTIAKLSILETYTIAWANVLAYQSAKFKGDQEYLLIVDGFAGQGKLISKRDRKICDGSPILAVKTISGLTNKLPKPVKFLFIDSDMQNIENLKERIKLLPSELKQLKNVHSIDCINGECEKYLTDLMFEMNKEKKPLGPAFFFLDQYGYSHVSLDLIKTIMSHPMCEVFLYFHYAGIHRFIESDTIVDAINKAYGGDEWKKALNLDSKRRSAFMLDAYKTALKNKANVRFVWHFAIRDIKNNLKSWLIFCTNNIVGLRKMKESMRKVGRKWEYCFSDKDDPSQIYSFKSYSEEYLINDLAINLQGRTMTISQIEEYVLTETPAVSFKNALQRMYREKKIKILNMPSNMNENRPSFSCNSLLIEFTRQKSEA